MNYDEKKTRRNDKHKQFFPCGKKSSASLAVGKHFRRNFFFLVVDYIGKFV